MMFLWASVIQLSSPSKAFVNTSATEIILGDMMCLYSILNSLSCKYKTILAIFLHYCQKLVIRELQKRVGESALAGVESAFAMVGIFPPPSAGADVLSFFYGPGATLAADAREAFFVQFVVGDAVVFYIGDDLLLGPLDERVEFDEAVCLVEFEQLHILAGYRLVAPQAGYPHFRAL